MKHARFMLPGLFGLLVLLAPGGCQGPQQRAREQAATRWNRARAQVKAKLAADQFAAGNVDAAADELAEACRLDPHNPGLVPLQARVWLAEGKSDQAAGLLERARGEAGGQAEVEYLLGIVWQQRQRWEAALEAFLRAVELNGEEVAYVVAAAQAWLQLGQPDAALEFLAARAERFGWTLAYQAALAECHEQVGDWAAAAAAWRRVAAAESAWCGIPERLAEALCQDGKWREAIPVLEGLTRDGAETCPTLLRLLLAECYLADGQPAAARQQVQAVLQQEHEHVPALRLLARILAREGDLSAALRLARRALAIKTDDCRTLELVTALAWRVGDRPLAVQAAARLGQLDPQSEVARLVRVRVGESPGPDVRPN